MNKDNTNELISQLNNYFTILNKLNNITYYNLQTTKKLMLEISKNGIDDYSKIKKLKLQIYNLKLVLEELENEINKYKEN